MPFSTLVAMPLFPLHRLFLAALLDALAASVQGALAAGLLGHLLTSLLLCGYSVSTMLGTARLQDRVAPACILAL